MFKPEIEWGEDIEKNCGLVEWLWPHHIPLSMMTMFVGDPGAGKSFLTMDIAARVTMGGPWPDSEETFGPGGVVVVIGEETKEVTSMPRFLEAGGKKRLISFINRVRDEETGAKSFFDLSKMEALVEACMEMNERAPLRLIIVDPVTAYMGKADSHKNAEVRAALMGITDFAREVNTALVCVSHMNKNEALKAIYRTIGSVGYTAMARLSWLVQRDPDDRERRLCLKGKSNLDEEIRGFAFRMQSVPSILPFRQKVGRQGDVLSYEPSDVCETADDMLGEMAGGNRTGTSLKEAMDWVTGMLTASPEGIHNAKLKKMAAEDDIKPAPLKRAKEKLGVVSVAVKGENRSLWVWKLPEKVTPEDKFLSGMESMSKNFKRIPESREGKKDE